MVILRDRLFVFWFFYLVKLGFGSQSIQFKWKMFVLRKIIFRLQLLDVNTRSSSLVNFKTKRKLWHSIIRISDKLFPVWVFRDPRQLISFQIIRLSISNFRMLFWIVICQRLFARQKPLTTNLAKFIVNRLASSFRKYFHDSVLLHLNTRSLIHTGMLREIIISLHQTVLQLSKEKLFKF
jgi:hypothetical protein